MTILKGPVLLPAIGLTALISGSFHAQVTRTTAPTFEQRLAAQAAIEQVYQRHRIGGRPGSAHSADPPIPAWLLEKKVRTYLKQSVALEEYWSSPITEAALRAEMKRIATHSRFPGRLNEIRAALHDDQILMMETLARASMADRLARGFASHDERIKVSWDSWWADAAPRFDEGRFRAPAWEAGHVAGDWAGSGRTSQDWSPTATMLEDVWGAGAVDPVPQSRREHTAIWTGSEMIIWGGYDYAGSHLFHTGSLYDPLTDGWTPMSTIDAPSGRSQHMAVWTGSEMIIWGGSPGGNTGGRYDPLSDTWTATSIVGAPAARSFSTAVWTGTLMIVWGGGNNITGGRYDPATDTWSPITTVGAPAPPRYDHTAVWTGDRMIVWGGGHQNTGGKYDPIADTWTPTSLVNAPTPRRNHAAVWTGSEMIVWGAFFSGFLPTGGRYNPATDQWTPTSLAGAPNNRYSHTAVWTGTEMIVWGGIDQSHQAPNERLQTGGRYNPQTDSWAGTSTLNAPSARAGHTAVWGDDLMIVWGAALDGSGGRYDAAADSWTPTDSSRESPVPPYSEHTAVWTGSEMIVWGGWGNSATVRYDAITDTWRPMSLAGAPSARIGHAAVWTRREMIVWGGHDGNLNYTNTGGRYDPAADAWTATATVGAPSARELHTAVWTGSEMIVWGGQGNGGVQGDGARYNPATDAWAPVSLSAAPEPRTRHTTIWTGSEMIVWGGSYSSYAFNTGGRYDPVTDTWTSTSTLMAPSARDDHTTVWTGSEMIVWGTTGGRTGGRYNPATDTWNPTTTIGAPAERNGHTAVWTGDRMIVWGGASCDNPSFFCVTYNTGGRYDPIDDQWAATTTTNSASARSGHTAVWTGQAMIVWGGIHRSGDVSGTLADDRLVPWYGSLLPIPDGDGDGVPDAGDCHDNYPLTWDTPGEVTDLTLSADTTLHWMQPASAGASSIAYDTLRSELTADFVSAAVCVETGDGTDTTATDLSAPAPDGIHYYLVRATNGCPGAAGIGPLGAGSDGISRAGRACP